MKSFLEEMTRPVIELRPANPSRDSIRKRRLSVLQGVIDLAEIESIVARRFGLTIAELHDPPNRQIRYRWPRQIAMALSEQFCAMSRREIGEYFRLDQATVRHACRTVKDMQECYADVRQEIGALRDVIEKALAERRAT